MKRQHPRYSWIWLEPSDWHQTLQRQSAPDFRRWCEEQAQNPDYRWQFQDRIAELRRKLETLQNEIDHGRLDLEPAAGMARREIRWLSGLIK